MDAALARLETVDRALLELSLHREIADVALADLLDVDPDDLGRRRLRALERLAAELGVEPDTALETALIERWRGRPLTARESEAADLAGPPAPAADGSWRAVFFVLTVAVLGVGIGLLVSVIGGDDDEPSRPAEREARDERPRAAQPRPARPRPRPVRFRPVAGLSGLSGSVQRAGDRVVLRLRGLPATDGHYAAWLYNSIADARPVARFGSDARVVRVRLPADPARYRFLDVSREPPDDNPNHSGASVLRVPATSLRR